MRRWPVWRTTRHGNRDVTWSDIAICLAAALMIPALLGGLLAGFSGLEGFRLFVDLIPLGIVVLPIGMLLFLYAIRIGRAGWGASLLAGALTSHLVVVFLAIIGGGFNDLFVLWEVYGDILIVAVPNLAFIGMVYAGVLWLTLYLLRPVAFLGGGAQPT